MKIVSPGTVMITADEVLITGFEFQGEGFDSVTRTGEELALEWAAKRLLSVRKQEAA